MCGCGVCLLCGSSEVTVMVMAQFVRGNPGGPGRPSRYNADVAAAICMQLIEGQSLRSICQEDGRPHVMTFFRWLDQHEPLRGECTIAKEIQGHMIYEEGIEIIDAAQGGTMEEIQVAKLRSDARFRWAGKVAPKHYADKQVHVGGDGEGPVGVKLALDYSALDPHEMVEFRRMIGKMEEAAKAKQKSTLLIEGDAEEESDGQTDT